MKVDIIHHREDIPLDDLRVVYDHWHEKLGGRFAPAWQDVDMVCFPPRVIPMCLVIDIRDQPRDLFFGFGVRILPLGHWMTCRRPAQFRCCGNNIMN
ncbi:MAG: hypothetical protein HOB37_18295 [Rhodospirillaceae bacterium]|nr:hypothetical protein [Rhodospirillaceae bacterium]MBT6883711.1 hypothetical protein [Rhodospirillaceae bacterium]MBT7249622.1 hypothetical protein [Rhodospirillaceae bacterium]MBT7512364.1 hypothetical protein [Rhodospirillaceae bacterium]